MSKRLLFLITLLLLATQATAADISPDKVDIQYQWLHQFQFEAIELEKHMMKSEFYLNEFINNSNPSLKDLTWLYRGLFVALIVISLITYTAIYIYRINRRLTKNLKESRQIEENYI